MTITELKQKIEESKEKIDFAKSEIERLRNIKYKPNRSKITVGHDEYEYREVSIGYINERKRENKIKNLIEDIKEFESDIVYFNEEIRKIEHETKKTTKTNEFSADLDFDLFVLFGVKK